MRATASASRVTALSCSSREPCAARPAGDQLDPDQGLLAGLHEVGALVAEGDRVAADLADGLGGAGEDLRVLLDQVVRAEHSAGFLVGEERDDEVAGRLLVGAEDVLERGEDHRIHVLHVDGAAAPEHAVLDDALERVDRPVVRLGGHHVEVAVDDQCASVGAGRRRGCLRCGRRR